MSTLLTISTEEIQAVSADVLLADALAFVKQAGLNLVWAAVVFVVGLVVIRYLLRFVSKILARSRIELTFHGFIKSIVKILLILVLVIICVSLMGLDTAPLIAALGAVGLAVSLAIKDSLSNFASGISLLSTKPFAVGDYVEIGACGGTVKEINLFHTVLTTPDNKRIYIPNATVSTAQLVNYSAEPNRRLDLTFSIGYQDSIERAREILLGLIEQSGMALPDPAPAVMVNEQGANAIQLLCRVWVAAPSYWDLRFFLLEQAKLAFDREGISIPYSQLDVRIVKE